MLRKAKTYASWLERKDMWRQSQKTFKKKQREIDRMSAGYGRAHFDVGPLSSAAEPEPSRALSLAERLRAEGSAPAGSAPNLVLRAAELWSPQTHQLFPSEARARAVEHVLLGARFSREDRFEKEDDPNAAIAMWDVWMGFVVPHAVTRG